MSGKLLLLHFVSLSVRLFACLFSSLFACSSVWLSVFLPVRLLVRLFVGLVVCFSACPSVCSPACSSVRLFVVLFSSLFVCLFDRSPAKSFFAKKSFHENFHIYTNFFSLIYHLQSADKIVLCVMNRTPEMAEKHIRTNKSVSLTFNDSRGSRLKWRRASVAARREGDEEIT